MSPSEKFQQEIMDLVHKRYPKAMRGDIGENTEAAAALATALGGLLAFAFRLNGEVIGRTVLQTIVHEIVENAAAIDEKNGAIIRNAFPKPN